MINYQVGDIVKLRKSHPCGSVEWEITRIGMDFRIKCLGCNHQVLVPRVKFEKSVKSIIRQAEKAE